MSALIEAEGLARLRRRAVILAARVGGAAPEEGIPGAFPVDVATDFSAKDHPLPCTVPEDPAAAFERLGVTAKKPVVVYDAVGGAAAARVWWLGHVAGLTNVAILDGGQDAWQETGRELGELADPAAARPSTLELNTEWERLADAADVRQIAETHNSFLVDVRPPERFAGEAAPRPGLRTGHIPGAANLPATAFFTPEGRFKDLDDVRDLLEEHIGPAGAVTFYSERGVTACVAALAANLAGYGDVRVYEGSWSEWGLAGNDEAEFPVARGPQ